MQGPSEFGVAGNAKLKYWDRKSDLCKIKVPTLTIWSCFLIRWILNTWNGWLRKFNFGSYLHCPKGSHLTMYDDQETYFKGILQFIKEVDKGNFSK